MSYFLLFLFLCSCALGVVVGIVSRCVAILVALLCSLCVHRVEWAVAVKLTYEVGSVHAGERIAYFSLAFALIPEKVFALSQLLFGCACRKDFLACLGVYSGIVHLGSKCHGCGGEVLYLLKMKVEIFGRYSQLGHCFFVATGVT